jgi:hypothetical protein
VVDARGDPWARRRAGWRYGHLLAAIAMAFALPWKSALFMGAALALSFTACAFQVMENNGGRAHHAPRFKTMTRRVL